MRNYIRPIAREALPEVFFDDTNLTQLQQVHAMVGRNAAVWRLPKIEGPWERWRVIGEGTDAWCHRTGLQVRDLPRGRFPIQRA